MGCGTGSRCCGADCWACDQIESTLTDDFASYSAEQDLRPFGFLGGDALWSGGTITPFYQYPTKLTHSGTACVYGSLTDTGVSQHAYTFRRAQFDYRRFTAISFEFSQVANTYPISDAVRPESYLLRHFTARLGGDTGANPTTRFLWFRLDGAILDVYVNLTKVDTIVVSATAGTIFKHEATISSWSIDGASATVSGTYKIFIDGIEESSNAFSLTRSSFDWCASSGYGVMGNVRRNGSGSIATGWLTTNWDYSAS